MVRFRRAKQAPESPTDLKRPSWVGVLKRTVKGFQRNNLTDWAAALTYYGVLAIFPALIVLVSVLGLIGSSATQPLLDNLGTVARGPAGLEDAAHPRGTDAHIALPARDQRDRCDAHWWPREADRRRDRGERHRGSGVGHREVACAAAHGELHVRAPLLGGAQR